MKKQHKRLRILTNKTQIMKLKHLFIIAAFVAALMTSCKEESDDEIIIEGNITTNTTWSEGNNYVIRGDVYIDNTTLTIQPGTTIRFEADASLSIGHYDAATIIANGTVNTPIIFTSTLENPTPGAWEGLFLESYASSNSSFKYCQIKYAGTSSYGALNIESTSCTFSNNTIQYAKKTGVLCENENAFFVEMNNNTISDCGGHAVRIPANRMHTIGTGNTFTCSDGYGINVWGGSDVTGTITWKNLTEPYYIEGEVDVDATLTIEAGTIFKFNADGSIYFGNYGTNTLIANGTSTNKIIFTSSAATPAAGAWNGIFFYQYNQQNSSMTFCEIAYAGKSNGEALELRNTKITFSNNTIHNSNESAIILDDESSFVEMNNNTISSCGKHAIIMNAKYFHTIGTGNSFTTASDMGIFLNSGDVTSTGTWRKQTVPIIINSEVDVNNTLTIEAGSTFKFGGDGVIYIGNFGPSAAIIAKGTSTNPIVFTAWSGTPAAGAWEGLHFNSYTTGASTQLEYCEFLFSGKGSSSDRASVYVDGVSGITIKNSKFENSDGWGIFLNSSTLSPSSTGNTFTSCLLGDQGNS